MAGVLGHSRLWWHAVLRRPAPLLDIALVGQCLRWVEANIGHVIRRHVGVGGHPGSRLLGRKVLARWFLGGFDLIRFINAVLIPRCGLGCVQASLCVSSQSVSMLARGLVNGSLSASRCVGLGREMGRFRRWKSQGRIR